MINKALDFYFKMVLFVIFFTLFLPSFALASNPSPWELNKKSQWARVYIDTSGSMRGFVDAPENLHARLLKRLRDILIDADVLNFEASSFGLSVSPSKKVAGFQEFSISSAYNQPDTYLAGPLEDAKTWKKNGIILILTDSVASITKYHGLGGDSANTCDLGSDTACVALRIKEYIKQGHGFWIVGLRFPFKGSYWVEEGGPNVKPGAEIPNINVSNRPFYIWIGSPDVNQGRQIVKGLRQFAKETKPQIPILSIEVAPGLWQRWEIPSNIGHDNIKISTKYCSNDIGLVSHFKAQGNNQEAPIVGISSMGRKSIGLEIPIHINDLYWPTETNTLYWIQYNQYFIYQSSPSKSYSFKWNPIELPNKKPDRFATLNICLRGQTPLITNQKITIQSKWEQKRRFDFNQINFPWKDWATDYDDTQESVNRTVNLNLFFRHLLNQISPESNQVENQSEKKKTQNFLRIQVEP